jgi:hypothetical protein
MREKLISIKTAELAKEKGFNWYCEGGYIQERFLEKNNYSHEFKLILHCDHLVKIPLHNPYYDAPTQSLLQKWLREVHNLQVYAFSSTINEKGEFRDYVVYINNRALNDARDEEFQTYEEAIEFGLLTALKELK